MKIHTPWSLDADRSRNHYVISDAEGNVAALVPGEENDAEPHNVPEDAEAKARAEAIVAAVNATPVHVPGMSIPIPSAKLLADHRARYRDLLISAVDSWTEFDGDQDVDAAALVSWFGRWRDNAKNALEATE